MEPEKEAAARPEQDLVLVVEDSLLVAMAIEDSLIERGLTVLVASTMEAAKTMVADEFPAVALLDLQLPDGNSLDLARHLHEAGCVVAITSGHDSGAVPESHSFAIQFHKPTSPDLLAEWVVTTLQSLSRRKAEPAQFSSCSRSGTG